MGEGEGGEGVLEGKGGGGNLMDVGSVRRRGGVGGKGLKGVKGWRRERVENVFT